MIQVKKRPRCLYTLFPGDKSQNVKPEGHLADFSDSSSADGVHIGASSPKISIAKMVIRASDSKARPGSNQACSLPSASASTPAACAGLCPSRVPEKRGNFNLLLLPSLLWDNGPVVVLLDGMSWFQSSGSLLGRQSTRKVVQATLLSGRASSQKV